MGQPIGSLKTVVRVINTTLFRHSDSSYQISIDLEALDCCKDVAEIEVYHHVHDMIQAWRILQPLRPGSIHYVEGNFRIIDKKIDLMAPDFCPYHGDIGEISKYFSNCDTRNGARALQPEGLKTVSGRIRDILIDETKDGDIAIIHLAERDDYGLVIFPDLFETYKRMILKEDYLEYNGIPQECFVTGNSSETMIFVTTIDIPTLTDEMEDNDHEQ